MKRRDFLKYIGIGGAGTGLGYLFGKVTKAPGNRLIPYLIPPEDILPGVGAYYATLCTECSAGCGILVKVMDGRARKIEGNPKHPVNKGKLCMRGQAGVQGLYNPDRIKAPMKRSGGRGTGQFVETSWDDAVSTLARNLTELGKKPEQLYLLTSDMRGHQHTVASSFMSGFGSPNIIRHDLLRPGNLELANRASMGLSSMPHYDIENTKYLLSFGADFSSTWLSPVSYGHAYGQMRQGGKGRGKLVQVEPRMSLTGANADEWVSARPGTEGVLALSIAYAIIEKGLSRAGDAGSWRSVLGAYRPSEAAKTVDVGEERIYALAKEFAQTRPSLAISGGNLEGYENGLSCHMAVSVLNHVAGNIGIKGGVVPSPEALAPRSKFDSKNSISRFVADAEAGRIQTLIVSGSNPVFTVPRAAKVADALAKIPFIASFSSYIDETTAYADIILPPHHPLEDWGDEFSEPGAGFAPATVMQPVVSPLYNTKGLGDIFITLAKAVGGKTAAKLPSGEFKDYLQSSWKEMYLRNRAMAAGTLTFDDFWIKTLSEGGWWGVESVKPRHAAVSVHSAQEHIFKSAVSKFEGDEKAYPLHLMLYPQTAMRDGSGANSPWLQEMPDPMTSVVWGSWAEINTKTAASLGISEGDVVSIESPFGKITAHAYLAPGIRPDTIAAPIGQGHSHYGRYAKDRGVNPMEILPFKENSKTGQIAINSTRVRITKTAGGRLVKQEGTARELGRDIVKTMTPEQFERIKG